MLSQFYFRFLLLGLAAPLLVSCNEYVDYHPLTSVEAAAQEKAARYQHDFEQTFGTIDADHHWGFVPMQAQNAPAATRAYSMGEEPDMLRVMCEDLANLDHDFNDVVFDVYFADADGTGNAKAHISLVAAGGTLPVYIGQCDEAHEVHQLFGVDTKTPVNVRLGEQVYQPVHLELDVTGKQVNGVWTYNANDIPVYVCDAQHAITLLETKVGGAPQKFACPVAVSWSNELTPITKGYETFSQWVGADNQYSQSWYASQVQKASLFAASSLNPVLAFSAYSDSDDSSK